MQPSCPSDASPQPFGISPPIAASRMKPRIQPASARPMKKPTCHRFRLRGSSELAGTGVVEEVLELLVEFDDRQQPVQARAKHPQHAVRAGTR